MRKKEAAMLCPNCLMEVWDVATIDQHLNKCWDCGLKFLNDTEEE
jgi:hypothetical protein